MKYLSDYTQQAQTDLFNKTGAFFAFSGDQLKEKVVKGRKYYNLGSGLICPQDTSDELEKGLSNIQVEGIKNDIADNGIKAIIHRELGNHEAQITGDISDTVDALGEYPIMPHEIESEYAEFYQLCVDNDWF